MDGRMRPPPHEQRASGAKAGDRLAALTARLKSCPSTKPCAPRDIWDGFFWRVRTFESRAFGKVSLLSPQRHRDQNRIREMWKPSVARHGRTNASVPTRATFLSG